MNTDQINKFAPRTGTGIFLAIVVVAFIPVILNAFPMLANLFYLYGHLIGMTLAGFVARLAPLQVVFAYAAGGVMIAVSTAMFWAANDKPAKRISFAVKGAVAFLIAFCLFHYATLLQSQL